MWDGLAAGTLDRLLLIRAIWSGSRVRWATNTFIANVCSVENVPNQHLVRPITRRILGEIGGVNAYQRRLRAYAKNIFRKKATIGASYSVWSIPQDRLAPRNVLSLIPKLMVASRDNIDRHLTTTSLTSDNDR